MLSRTSVVSFPPSVVSGSGRLQRLLAPIVLGAALQVMAVECGVAVAQPLERLIGTQGDEKLLHIEQTRDGGFISTGSISAASTAPSDIYLVRHQPDGKVLWSRAVGGQGRDVGYSVLETTDGGFVVAAETDALGAFTGIALLKFTAAGAPLWARVYEGTAFADNILGQSPGVQVREVLPSGDLVVVGHEISGTAQFGVAFRTTSFGIPIWQRRYLDPTGQLTNITLSDLKITSSTAAPNAVVSGTHRRNLPTGAPGDMNMLYMLLDIGTGFPVLAIDYDTSTTGGPPINETGDSIDINPTTGLVYLNGRTDYGAGNNVFLGSQLLEANLGGGPIFQLRFRSLFSAVAGLRLGSDGNPVWAGRYTPAAGTNFALLQKTSVAGVPVFTRAYRFLPDNASEAVVPILVPPLDGYALIGGSGFGGGYGQTDGYFIRTRPDGTVPCPQPAIEALAEPILPLVLQFALQPLAIDASATWSPVVRDPVSRDSLVCPTPTTCCNVADIVSIGGLPPCDGLLTGDDFNAFINAFAINAPLADIVSIGGLPPPDGLVTGDDFNAFINAFANGCP